MASYTTPFKPSTLKLYGGSGADIRTMTIEAKNAALEFSYVDNADALKPLRISGLETPDLTVYPDDQFTSGTELMVHTQLTTNVADIARNEADITSEAATARAAESTNAADIATEITDRQNAISTEQTARAAADLTLQTNIDAEAVLARAAEQANADDIATEINDRSTQDGILQTNISAETTARTTADTVATTDRALIRTEFAAADTALVATAADDRALIRTEFGDADTALDAKITTNTTDITTNTTGVAANLASLTTILDGTTPEGLNTLKEIVDHFEIYGLSYAQRLFRIEEFIEDIFGIANFNDQETMPSNTDAGPDFDDNADNPTF